MFQGTTIVAVLKEACALAGDSQLLLGTNNYEK